LATEVGRRLRQLGIQTATILVKTTDKGMVVKVDADGTTAVAEIAPTPTVATTTEGRKDAKGKAIADKLAQAASAFGLELKEWQVRSIAFHFPQIAKSLVKQTHNGILSDPNFREAVRMYAEWHPERRGELPQEVLADADADANAEA
jgi:O-succinylbenzoate synthase